MQSSKLKSFEGDRLETDEILKLVQEIEEIEVTSF